MAAAAAIDALFEFIKTDMLKLVRRATHARARTHPHTLTAGVLRVRWKERREGERSSEGWVG